MEEEARAIKKGSRVCLTGAGGFVASWLVKLLLSHGYHVHATVRDPCDKKNSHLKKLENAMENLQLFKADLLDYDSILAAAAGCEGVFHVASPVPTTKVPNPEVELISPAVTGTQNVLKACSTLRVKRVVVVSSGAAVILNPHWPKGKVMDEECWSDPEHCRMTENWYCLSKTLAEADTFKYAKENDLDVVTVCPSMVLGPIMQPTLNASTLFLINILKGLRESKENSLYHTVDVRDVADALLLVYEKPEASGRYICASHPIKIRELIDTLRSIYPNYNYPNNLTEVDYGHLVSSEKLKKLGWKCRPLKETLVDSVESYKEAGLLNN
ncbi:cinnamoyl-CoA reductase 1-like [Dioscorea cayenensis subsp. rotundata]|uniref:Cinnamoyl-CoA reductase 1-like n=1 Tax=Dioscorea cayennensis subsp. rotundata TaxID=55577 RepID=A0AB40BFP8_DIOCR|nr:cinnamoyl-CoA reductase 1-like [Dioscorea cayenensis subsp. rotundata]